MRFKLINIEERNHFTCFFCGTDKSVKYEIKLFDDPNISDISRRYCCNKCILMLIDNKYDYKIATANNLATNFGLTQNQKYIIMKHKYLYGILSVYDLNGNYLTECRTDCFEDYHNFIE